MKVGLYFYLSAESLTNVLQKCSLSSPVPSIWILSKPLNWVGCHGNRKAKFANKFSKTISSEAIRWGGGRGGGVKLKLCRTVNNISLYKRDISFLCWLCFRCYGNIKFPFSFNGKSENLPLLISQSRYFDKSFTELFLE